LSFVPEAVGKSKLRLTASHSLYGVALFWKNRVLGLSSYALLT
jgi:hypothetical protein